MEKINPGPRDEQVFEDLVSWIENMRIDNSWSWDYIVDQMIRVIAGEKGPEMHDESIPFSDILNRRPRTCSFCGKRS